MTGSDTKEADRGTHNCSKVVAYFMSDDLPLRASSGGHGCSGNYGWSVPGGRRLASV
jgi:hypothetical protein